MTRWYDRYQQGMHEEVYNKLLNLGDTVQDPDIYEEAYQVMSALMKRVHYNIQQLVSRLQHMGYLFYEGLPDKEIWQQEAPLYKAATLETHNNVTQLQHIVGPLPLSIQCWYSEIESVNFTGLFPPSTNRLFDRSYGSETDPLVVLTPQYLLPIAQVYVEDAEEWAKEPFLPIAPDKYHKYRFSGGGPYDIQVKKKAFDTLLRGQEHDTTFVNYLRHCFQWGGFPGLEKENRLDQNELYFLTKDLLPF